MTDEPGRQINSRQRKLGRFVVFLFFSLFLHLRCLWIIMSCLVGYPYTIRNDLSPKEFSFPSATDVHARSTHARRFPELLALFIGEAKAGDCANRKRSPCYLSDSFFYLHFRIDTEASRLWKNRWK